MFKVLLVISLAVFAVSSEYIPWPDKMPRCHAEDTACVVKTANFFVRQFKNGDTGLGIPNVDPYIYNGTIHISPRGGGSFNMNLEGKNNVLSGLSAQTYTKAVGFTKDINTSKFELYGTAPKLTLEGDYKATGKILGADIKGEGKYKIVIEDVIGNIKFKPTITKVENGKTFIKVNKIKLLLKPKKAHFEFSNLCGGTCVLGDAINQLLNDNGLEMWNELSPSALKTAEKIMLDILNRAIDRYAFEDLYLP